MSHGITLDHVTMRFGGFTAVRDVSLVIEPGEFFSFLGPSGCGKSTILRMICGFEEPSEGRILIGGRDMRGIGPNKRPTAMIFQNLALFPLMSVAENIAFGLEVRGVGKAERRRKAEELLELIALPEYADSPVAELSGGQQQRVAIARALAVEPTVLLLDEPLSALDLKLRQHMRSELRAIQKRTGVTFIYITHDQGEALTMSDRVAVMSQGVVQQVALPEDIYENPATPFVATFVGETNRIPGRIVGDAGNGAAEIDTPLGRFAARNPRGLGESADAVLFVRPERLSIGDTGIPAEVRERHFEGAFVNIEADASGTRLFLQVVNDGRIGRLEPGTPISIGFGPKDAVLLPPEAAV